MEKFFYGCRLIMGKRAVHNEIFIQKNGCFSVPDSDKVIIEDVAGFRYKRHVACDTKKEYCFIKI